MQISPSILSEKANKINIFWSTVSKDAVAEKANRLYEWTGNERTMVASGNIQTGPKPVYAIENDPMSGLNGAVVHAPMRHIAGT